MVCGCLYIYNKFTNEVDTIDIYADNNTTPVTSAKHNVPEFCVVIDVKAILEDNNIEVVLTRSSDKNISLAQRTSIANESNADFFISLHCNYYEDDAQIAGLECYYNSPDAMESIINAFH